MKVLFIYPNTVPHPKDISIGLAYLSAYLKENGHQVKLLDTTFGMKDAEITEQLLEYNPELVGLSATTANFSYATHIATFIKKVSKTPVIIGGVHPTVDPEETIKKNCFDMICVGEGEEALLELISSLAAGEKRTDIKNLWYKKNGKIIRNPPRILNQDLDVFPFPNLQIYDYERYLMNHNRVASVLGSRGCPFKCTYCINHSNQVLYSGLGAYVRYRRNEKIIEEIKAIISKFKVNELNFYDETFTLNASRVKEFCTLYKEEIGLPFHINARLDTLTDEMCSDLAEAGCVRIAVGLESGSPRLRKQILKKNITDEQIIAGSRYVKKYGIKLFTYNMIGIPGETRKDIQMTIDLNRKVQPDFLHASIFTAFKGTELYDKCKEQGLLDESIVLQGFANTTNVKHPEFTFDQLKTIQKHFAFNVFRAFDVKKAIINIIDRYLHGIRYYSRLRSLLIAKFVQNS